MVIIDELFKLQDKDYAIFQSKLTHGIPYGSFIGIGCLYLENLQRKLLVQLRHASLQAAFRISIMMKTCCMLF